MILSSHVSSSCPLQVCSIVELVGLIICLHAAAKITHRAQGIGSIASRWHAIVTCNPNDVSQSGGNGGGSGMNNGGGSETAFPSAALPISYSESDLESVDFVPVPTNSQLVSHASMYQKRQALGMHLKTSRMFISSI